MGLKTFAVEVDLMPKSGYAKEESASGRVTTLMTFKELNPHTQTIFVPNIYVEQLKLLNSNMPTPRTINISYAQPAKGTSSIVETQVFTFAQVARLTIREIGQDIVSLFENMER
ncbi:MAG: hypothetical protein N3D15_07005 [Syntrophorhabdaceae bacterium]|nr:hypothetical protein [Syntrophorhabdaceae bacterium]